MASCVSRQEEGAEGENALRIQKERQQWNIGYGPPARVCLLLPAREAGLPGAHSFSQELLRDFFVLVCMPGALITRFLPVAIGVLAASNSNHRRKWRGLG